MSKEYNDRWVKPLVNKAEIISVTDDEKNNNEANDKSDTKQRTT